MKYKNNKSAEDRSSGAIAFTFGQGHVRADVPNTIHYAVKSLDSYTSAKFDGGVSEIIETPVVIILTALNGK